jgi:hypothetical protein
MTVDTHIERARTRVQTELEIVEAKLEAAEDFLEAVEALSTASAPSPTADTSPTGAGLVRAASTAEDHCRTVRQVFTETIRPHSIDDLDGPEPLLETVRAELSEEVAVALAPTTDTSFTPAVKRAVVAEASSLRGETGVMRRALERERAGLDTAGDTVDDVVGWVVDADETPLTALGFEALRERHETLARHRDRCERLAERRQAFLAGTTNDGVDVGLRHRRLVRYLYDDFPMDYPVLVTVARLDDACAQCQRAVRRHLVRRG